MAACWSAEQSHTRERLSAAHRRQWQGAGSPRSCAGGRTMWVLRSRAPDQVRRDALAAAERKATKGCVPCAEAYISLAAQHGANAAVVDGTRRRLFRRAGAYAGIGLAVTRSGAGSPTRNRWRQQCSAHRRIWMRAITSWRRRLCCETPQLKSGAPRHCSARTPARSSPISSACAETRSLHGRQTSFLD